MIFLPIYFCFPHKWLEILALLSSVTSAVLQYKASSSDFIVSMAQWAEWGECIDEQKKARERERAHTYSLESASKRISLQIPDCCLLHARPWHFNKRRVPTAFSLGEKCILRAVCFCCLSQYICWRNCKLTFYYSSFHGRHWVREACGFLRYYLNLSSNEEERTSFPLSCSDLPDTSLFSRSWEAVSNLTFQYG